MAACCTAEPPICSDRLAMVPLPEGTRSVSPWTMVMRSSGSPSVSEVIMLNAVARPWPCGDVPVRTVARASPSGWADIRTAPNSLVRPDPVIST